MLGEIFRSLFADTGTILISAGLGLIIMMTVTDISLVGCCRALIRAAKKAALITAAFTVRTVEAWRESRKKAAEEAAASAQEAAIAAETIQIGSPAAVDEESSEKPEKQAAKAMKATGDIDAEDEKQIPVVVKKAKKKRGKKKAAGAHCISVDASGSDCALPPFELLSSDSSSDDGVVSADHEKLRSTASRLVRVLGDFGVMGEVREIHPGPVVTMYEFVPNSGTKLSKIENLSGEVAMALEVNKVRVVAPIPGKNAVGFEIPNNKRAMVALSTLIKDTEFHNSKRLLPLALGKDINGRSYYVDLAKMPHLLIAGTTGSGKSVSINAMILSLLYRYTPEEVRFLMIDPKMIELGVYMDIPHLLLPVVTDMSKAAIALKWAVDEMERRYQLFSEMGARNIGTYNKKIQDMPEDEKIELNDEGNEVQRHRRMPFIIVVIDELADLMMIAARDVETSVARLAQKARAAGIHLMVATQRPSTDVITGLIKANFPSRISFRVSSAVDSRTILAGKNGGESLLGKGDMLILPPGTSELTRVHGAFVDDDEIKRVASFLREQGNPRYDESILEHRDDDEFAEEEEFNDELYDRAVALVAETRQASISMIQRRMRIGYNRAARMVERMEKEGIVGPANGSSPRDVLVNPH